jgi:hypothetical protein
VEEAAVRRQLVTLLSTVSVVALLGACGHATNRSTVDGKPAATGTGSVQPSGAPVAAVDPCTLPTTEEIVAALGQRPDGPGQTTSTPVTNCFWTSPSADHWVGVGLDQAGGLRDIPLGFGWSRKAFDDLHIGEQPVGGVGDAAWFLVWPDSGHLSVLKGEFAFNVYLVFNRAKDRPPPDTLLAALRPFALGIASRR